MKKQLNPVVIVVAIVILVLGIGGWFFYSTYVPTKSTSFAGPDGKRHFPRPASGGGGAKTDSGSNSTN